MKKILSLLSVLTISGTAVPTTIAASPYQKEETLNREKRDINWTPSRGESLESWYQANFNTKHKMTLNYNSWLYVREIYSSSSSIDNFVSQLYNKIGSFLPNNGNMNTSDKWSITNFVGRCIYNNWNHINNKINEMQSNNFMRVTTYNRDNGDCSPVIF